MTLALSRGESPAATLESMDSWEWGAWKAFMAVSPFGPLREDLRAAEIVCAQANTHGARIKPGDVFATLRPPRRPGKKSRGPADRSGFTSRCPALAPVEA